jgi:small GTP-binding protein
MEESSADHPFKVILVGDLAVGKTSLIDCFCGAPVGSDHLPTIGVAGHQILVPVDGEDVLLNIWDTAGSEAYSTLVQFYARGTVVAIIVASAVDRPAIDRIDEWIRFITNAGAAPSVVIALNKADLVGDPNRLCDLLLPLTRRSEHVRAVSAQTGFQVPELFQMAADLARRTSSMESAALAERPAPNAGCC